MLEALVKALQPGTRLCVAVDLTLPTESVLTLPASAWRGRDFGAYARRPALFALQA